MQFGIFNLMQRRDPAESQQQVFQHVIDSVKLAEDIGFEIAWFAEHHFSDYCLSPSPLLPIIWCAGQTSRIRLAPGVLVTPLYDPLRLVQEIAWIDQVTDGRFILGVGTGYQSFEFERFGLDLTQAGDRFMEIQDILEMGLTSGEVEYQGKYYQVPHTKLAVRPRDGLPDVVVAGVLNHPGIRERVAKANHMVLLSPGWSPFALVESQKSGYGEVFAATGRDSAEMRLAVMRFVHVTDNKRDARDAVEQFRYSTRVAVALRFNYGEFDGTVHHDIPAREEPTLDEMLDNMIIGDAETCAAKIIDEIQRLSPSHYLCYMKGGSMPAHKAQRSLERFGAEVLPMVTTALPELADIGGSVA